MRIKQFAEGAMMDDEGTYVYGLESSRNVSITVRANSAEEADRLLSNILMDADDLGIHFSEEAWQLVSSF